MNIKRCFTAMVGLALSFNVSAKEFATSGLASQTVFNPERESTIEVDIWYPTTLDSASFEFGKNKVFVGTKTNRNAPVASGKHPVVLLAHGGMRAAPFHAGWVASGLAKAGFIVVVPQQLGFSAANVTSAPSELWLRPSDLSISLTHLIDTAPFKQAIDTDHVYGIGFFLGGTSMLSLAGAKFEPALYKQSCTQEGVNIDCRWLQKNKVDLSKVSESMLGRTNHDDRVKAIVAINPELTKTLDAQSLGDIKVPVKVMDIRGRHAALPELEVAESIAAIPQMTLMKTPHTTIFSAFSRCTEKGVQILALEGEGHLCQTSAQQSREEAHRLIMNAIIRFIDHQ
ncbi:hypothetical protein BZG20_00065 [Salinivibrio sp. IB868]|uniref:alpha/beta hydrolase family protein n=1 Tax=unclassified Salinivibrio TaxID=2636825 RepID=UPI000986A078|nr:MULTISPECIES: hypothetical protein [unclassified Salinivibrio]OOE69372.1 hypothetical protein BZG20_00065 [Salinivibrio sp. IB868]OOE76696.1 hypothetical protein BZG22_03810 [Salinivibrio sp. IB870]